MQNVITFIENFAMEPELYWQVPHLYSGAVCELQWQKRAMPKRWRFRASEDQPWVQLAPQEVTPALQAAQVNLAATRRQIGASIITQAVYASLVVEAAEKIFGQDTLQKAFSDTNHFIFELLKRVSSILDEQTQTEPQKQASPSHSAVRLLKFPKEKE